MSMSVRFKEGLGETVVKHPHPIRWEARILIGLLSLVAILLGAAGLFIGALVLWAIITG
jgi:hypothetical protein